MTDNLYTDVTGTTEPVVEPVQASYEIPPIDEGSTYSYEQGTYNYTAPSYDGEASGNKINKHLFTWVFCFLLGGLGIDRFVRGQIGLGIVKLLFGSLTFGIWWLVDVILAIIKSYTVYTDTDELTFIQGKYSR